MITESEIKCRRQLLIDEILNGPLKLRDIAQLRYDDCCCFWGIACEVYRRETGKGQWVNSGDQPLEPEQRGYFDLPGDHPRGSRRLPVAASRSQ